MNRHAITVAFLLAAAVFYQFGFGFGVGLALVAGFISELIVWVRVSGALTKSTSDKTSVGSQ